MADKTPQRLAPTRKGCSGCCHFDVASVPIPPVRRGDAFCSYTVEYRCTFDSETRILRELHQTKPPKWCPAVAYNVYLSRVIARVLTPAP